MAASELSTDFPITGIATDPGITGIRITHMAMGLILSTITTTADILNTWVLTKIVTAIEPTGDAPSARTAFVQETELKPERMAC